MFERAIEIGNAAGFELGGVFGIEHQIPHVFGHGFAIQGFLHHLGIDGQRVDAPEIGHGVFVARVHLLHQLEQVRVEIAVVGDLAFVDGLVGAGLDLAAYVGNGGHHQIVAAAAAEHFGFEGFVVVVVGGADGDAGFLGEGGEGGGVDIIRPVVEVEQVGVVAFWGGGFALGLAAAGSEQAGANSE